MEISDRLSLIYPNKEDTSTEKKAKFFSGGQPTLFMSFNKRDSGQINPGYIKNESDDEEDDSENLVNGDGGENDGGENDSTTSKDTSSRRTSDENLEFDPNEPVENLIPNGRLKDFKVGFNDLRESHGPPPEGPALQRPAERRSTKPWDIFRTTAKESSQSDEENKYWNTVNVITKIIVCAFLFFLVLGTAVISKTCLIIITSNIHLFPFTSMGNNSRQSLRSANGALDFSGTSGSTVKTNVLWIWALIMIMGTPYFFILVRCTWRLVFQVSKRKAVTLSVLIPVLFIETLHSVGLIVMVFLLIPSFDPISGLLFTMSIAVIPSALKIWFPRANQHKEGLHQSNGAKQSFPTRVLVACFSYLAAVGQLAAIGLWCYHIYLSFEDDFKNNIPFIVCMVLAPIFISTTWWENFVYAGKKDSSGLSYFARRVRQMKTKLTFCIALWKLILLIVVPIAIFGILCDETGGKCVDALFMRGNANLSSSLISSIIDTNKFFGKCNNHLPLIVAAVCLISSGVCFKSAKVACKIMTQVVDFSLPLVLSTPVTIGIILGMYSGFITTGNTGCSLPFPKWRTDMNSARYFGGLSDDWENFVYIIAGLVGFLSLLLVTNYIWLPGKQRLKRTDLLFVQPLYCGIFTDQSLILNRRRIEANVNITDTQETTKSLPLPDNDMVLDLGTNTSPYKTDETPMIYMCATMWHENQNEMTQLLKSIFRMDEDQCTRKNYQLLFNRRDPDYYEFEAHIFFDDAFEAHTDKEYDFKVNSFVKELIKTVRVSASAIMGLTFSMSPPTKVGTPYGGRLIWALPGGNKLIAHLKDKAVIRHRKRWSQVMYMYYFLGFKLLNEGLSRRKLEKRAKNTFLLALDGDVDFRPPAVQLLVDRMKKNSLVGAACGRIHPIGNGAMVWYQKFEYAVSHWLQKAAEDKLGCVLCSPGCFSLFRGSALMDDNVMNRYTTPPTEPRHYVQYDQGEDRWLCTLLLQQGHRVEYCAASDALTYAPEGFFEFFNQRRRWTPSTMANIMDLLTDWKNVTSRNPEISFMYVFYQALLMVSSILTPGTIFLLILGAINMAYPSIDLWVALVINLLPVTVMVVLCFISTSQVQLNYAGILSTGYSLVMMIVLVGLLINAAQNGFCSITTIFLLFVAGVFVISAFLHPREFWCLIHGGLYFLAIPAMSMVLMLYSLGNLHVVSWGTRENKQPGGGEPQPKKPQDRVVTWLERFMMCCNGGERRAEDTLRKVLDRLDAIEDNISTVGSERTVPGSRASEFMRSRSRSPAMMVSSDSRPFSAVQYAFEGGLRENQIFEEEEQVPRDMLRNPFWMSDDTEIRPFKEAPPLDKDEVTFWRELIDSYLTPLEGDQQRQKDLQASLIELRNKVCLIFILVNSLFIIIVFTLQRVTAGGSALSLKLPCANENSDNGGQSVEPISVAFTLVFGLLLLVQFLCMLMHRFATLLHICASTTIFEGKKLLAKFKKDPETGTDDGNAPVEVAISVQAGLDLVRAMQMNADEDSISITSDSSATSLGDISELDDDLDIREERKQIVKNRWKRLAHRRHQLVKKGNTLNANFRKKFVQLQEVMNEEMPDDVSIAQEERDDDSELNTAISSFQQRKEFKGFGRQSLHTMAIMRRNRSLKDYIAKKRTKYVQSRWRNVADRAILSKLSQVVSAGAKADGDEGTRTKKMSGGFVQVVQATTSGIQLRNNLDALNNPSYQNTPVVDRKHVPNENEDIELDTYDGSKQPGAMDNASCASTPDVNRKSTNSAIHLEHAAVDDTIPKINIEPVDQLVSPMTSPTPYDTNEQSDTQLPVSHQNDDQWPQTANFTDDENGYNMENADTLF